MHITRKIDRAFQWAGEKMGSEAKTTMSEDFKMLETEMALRFDGMERLQRSMSAYVKWLGRRGETFEDKEKGLAVSYLGRTMISHGDDFEPDSEFGNCLLTLGRANERLAALQERFVADATSSWLESLERSLAMMKDYQSARKKLENRRLAYDASIGKMHKAKREDFRIEEELRTNKAKYEEASEDVVRRMQDIKDAEVDSVRDLTRFLDAELDYHERCAEELRRVRRSWPGAATADAAHGGYFGGGSGTPERRSTVGGGGGGRSRSNTAHSYSERLSRTNSNTNTSSLIYEEPEPEPSRMPIRSNSTMSRLGTTPRASQPPDRPARPSLATSQTFHPGLERERPSGPSGRASGSSTPGGYGGSSGGGGGGGGGLTSANNSQSALNLSSLRGQLRPTSRIVTSHHDDVFADRGAGDDDTGGSGGSGSPDWGADDHRSASPATSFDSLSRSTSNISAAGGGTGTTGYRKAPPPPPPSRAKKPPPPVPVKREMGY